MDPVIPSIISNKEVIIIGVMDDGLNGDTCPTTTWFRLPLSLMVLSFSNKINQPLLVTHGGGEQWFAPTTCPSGEP